MQVLQFNVPGGKKNRGLAVVQAFEVMASKDKLTEENLKLANYLGWCVELVIIHSLTMLTTEGVRRADVYCVCQIGELELSFPITGRN